MSSIVVRPGQSNAVARTSVTIIMMIDAALGQLKDLGYERGFDEVELVDNGDFPYVTLDGEIVFEVFFDADPKRGLAIKGDWRFQPPKKRRLWLIKTYRWLMRKLRLA